MVEPKHFLYGILGGLIALALLIGVTTTQTTRTQRGGFLDGDIPLPLKSTVTSAFESCAGCGNVGGGGSSH